MAAKKEKVLKPLWTGIRNTADLLRLLAGSEKPLGADVCNGIAKVLEQCDDKIRELEAENTKLVNELVSRPTAEMVKRAEDAEAVRWQTRIEETIASFGVSPIDPSGNESGDPLDWTDDQVKAALAALGARSETDRAVARAETAWASVKG